MKPSTSRLMDKVLPGKDKLNRKKIVYSRVTHKPQSDLNPRRPPPQNGLRIRLNQPLRGATLKTAPFRIVVQDAYTSPKRQVVEQIGEYDVTPRLYRKPAPNLLDDGDWVLQKRLEWNKDRLIYWLSAGARPSPRIVWLMQLTGLSLDPQEHKAEVQAAEAALEPHERLNFTAKANQPLPISEYKPDIDVHNDPKQEARLEMRARSRHYRNVTLEPGSIEWLEAQTVRPEMQADQEFRAAQEEPYPIIPPGLQRDPDLEPSRFARDLPVWVARGAQKQVDERLAALGRDNIARRVRAPIAQRIRQTWSDRGRRSVERLPLEEPPASQSTQN